MGMHFGRDEAGAYKRRPTRGLDLARVMYPEGGGLEFAWKLRRALEDDGVQLIDRLFVTGLMRGGSDRITGAVGINSRTGEFNVIKARATIVATNAITFRSGFVRDITGTGTLLAYRAGASLRNAEFSYVRPGTPKFYFEGITFAIQEGARWVNAKGEAFMDEYEPEWGDQADVPRIAKAMAMENRKGNTPLYLDMSPIPEHLREYFIQSKVKWMDYFFRKLGDEAKTDMFGKTPYYALNQMTKMGIRTGADCRSDVPGLLSAGLAQAGCANHFAGFHIGLCVGNGWIAGKSAIEDLDRLPPPSLDAAEVRALHAETNAPLNACGGRGIRSHPARSAGGDVCLRHRHPETRGPPARRRSTASRRSPKSSRTSPRPHTHELVRLKETEAMLLAARFILGASLYRTEFAAEPFPRGSRSPRRRQLALLGRRDRWRQRPFVQQDAGADALLFGDVAAAEAVAPCGARSGGWGVTLYRVRTMKSVYSPVSSDSLLSDTISEEPGVISSEMRSTSSGGMTMRSSAAAGLGIGAATSTALAGSWCALAALLDLELGDAPGAARDRHHGPAQALAVRLSRPWRCRRGCRSAARDARS